MGPAVHADALRILAALSSLPIAARGPVLIGGSPVGDGCVVRIAATSFEAASSAVREQLQFVPSLLGDDPWARKW
jgi:urease accessory protein